MQEHWIQGRRLPDRSGIVASGAPTWVSNRDFSRLFGQRDRPKIIASKTRTSGALLQDL